MTSSPYGPELNRLAALWSAQPQSTVFAPLAEALRKCGALEQATSVAASGIAAHPDYLPGRLVMARIYRDQGEHLSAEAELRAAMALDGTHPVVLEELRAVSRVAVAASEPEEVDLADIADGDLTGLPDAEPVMTESLAMLYWGQGHLEQAATVFDALAARAPENGDLVARRDAVRAELEIARPKPFDAAHSGGRPVREWLSGFAASRTPGPPPPSSFDAFYQTASAPPSEAGDLAAFQAWLRDLDR